MAIATRVQRGQADPMELAQREFAPLLGRVAGGRARPRDGNDFGPDAGGVGDADDDVYAEAELAGFEKEEVDITLETQPLTISAERKSESKQGNGNKGELLLHERRYTRFLRSFTLPPTV